MAHLLLKLLLAVMLGSMIGLERECKRKGAGLQTYSLVSLGTCLFTIVSFESFYRFSGMDGVSFDPSRVILAVATGIGFIGGGVIIYKKFSIEGLTTASALWVTSAMGVAVGLDLYYLALASAVFTVLILVAFGEIEKKFFNKDEEIY